MNWNAEDIEEREKTKLLTKIGCFFGVVIMGFLMIVLMIWVLYRLFVPHETQLMVSDSPNNKNKIEIVRIEDFPDPTLSINYENKSIMKTKLPDDIAVEWKNDNEADVILAKQGSEPDIIKVEFDN